MKPEDVNCDGCIQAGKLVFRFCNTCSVRGCVLERSLRNCAYCSEYPCKKLDDLLKSMDALAAKSNLDEIRKSI